MQIRVQFTQIGDMLTTFTISGHDALTEDSDYSVLCAAVSSAVMLTCNTLTEYFDVPQNAVQIHASGSADNRISLSLPHVTKQQSDILRGLYLHCTALAAQYAGRLSVTIQKP